MFHGQGANVPWTPEIYSVACYAIFHGRIKYHRIHYISISIIICNFTCNIFHWLAMATLTTTTHNIHSTLLVYWPTPAVTALTHPVQLEWQKLSLGHVCSQQGMCRFPCPQTGHLWQAVYHTHLGWYYYQWFDTFHRVLSFPLCHW